MRPWPRIRKMSFCIFKKPARWPTSSAKAEAVEHMRRVMGSQELRHQHRQIYLEAGILCGRYLTEMGKHTEAESPADGTRRPGSGQPFGAILFGRKLGAEPKIRRGHPGAEREPGGAFGSGLFPGEFERAAVSALLLPGHRLSADRGV